MKIENNLDSDNIRGLVIRLAIPSMLAQFVNVLYSIVDRMYIGNIKEIGEVALAGVGVCSPIVTLIAAFSFLIGAGGAPIMSIKLGEKKEKEAKQVLANAFFLLCVVSVFIMGISLILKEKLLMWFGASAVTFPYANEYIRVYVLGTVFSLLSAGMNQFIICQGYAKKSMTSVLIGAGINIILDPIMIFYFGLGVEGAAWATVIAQGCSCLYVLMTLFGKNIPIRITFGNYSWKLAARIMILGMSPFLIIASDSIILIAMNSAIQKHGGADLGDKLLTCTAIVQSFMLIVTMPLGGITTGTQTILGYNYGARRTDRVLKAEKNILTISILYTGIMFLIAHAIPQYFVMLFTQNSEYVQLSIWGIKVYTLAIMPLAVQYVVVDGLSGMGLAKYAISLSMFRKFLFLGCVFLLPLFFQIPNIFYAEPISDVISAISSGTFYLLFLKRILQKRELEQKL